jgi:hypothetical protein
MATTRKVMRTIESVKADSELLASLLSARSDSEVAVAFTLLRYSLSDPELLQLANLREILRVLPTEPFRTGQGMEILERSARYESTGRSYRRSFESSRGGVFGVEFLGEGHFCTGIVIHTPTHRWALAGDGHSTIHEALIPLLVKHGILLDAILEALELLGMPLSPTIYVSADDFIAECGRGAARETLDGLF